MWTSVRNAFWVRGPRSGAKMVAGLDDVCDRLRLDNEGYFECFLQIKWPENVKTQAFLQVRR